MPKIQEETIQVTLSKLIKNSEDPTENPIVQSELLATLESVVQELIGDGVIVEVNLSK